MFEYGIVGFGSQGKRVYKILRSKKIIILKKKKINIKNLTVTQNVEDLKNCKYIFLCSPNSTHYKYLTEKNFSNSYIFCEKPPVITKKQLEKLKKLNLKKIYFNFNYRFSKINEAIQLSKKFNFGNMLYGSIMMGHGLASKKEYKQSWRKKESSVYEVLGPHIIDLININFKIKDKVKKIRVKRNKKINSFFYIKTKDDGKIDVFLSYISPFVQSFKFIFENGILTINKNNIELRGPRNTFDKKGFFITPKILIKKIYNQKLDYEKSLEKSLKNFIKTAKKGMGFNKRFTYLSLQTNKVFLDGIKNYD